MKKIIVGILTFATLFVGQNVFAYVTWNDSSQGPDCPGSGIGIPDGNGGGVGIPDPGSNDCWSLTQVSGVAGGDVNVQLYYHNTGNQNAVNTKAFISVSPALGVASTTHTFTSYLTSSPTGASLGTVTLHLPTAQSLSMDSNGTWLYAHQSTSPTGYSGTQITTPSGLSLGTLVTGWTDQGSIVSHFHISNNQPQVCKIDSFSASDYSVGPGDSVTLYWTTTGCTNIHINGVSGTLSPDDDAEVHPYQTTTYTLNASGQNGSDSKQLTVNVSQPAQPTGNISANPHSCTIASGASTCNSTLTWNTVNPVGTSSVTHNGSTIYTGNSGVNKPINVGYGTQTYYLHNNNTLLDQDSVTASCETGTTWSNGYCRPASTPTMTGDINANPMTCYIQANHFTCPSTLTWNTQNPVGTSSVTHNNTTFAVGNSGTKTASINYGIQTYYLYNNNTLLDQVSIEARCASGTTWNGNYCRTNTTPTTCKITSFYASPSQIGYGETSTLRWFTSDCDYVKLEGVNVTPVASGSQTTGTLYSTKTYHLTAGDYNSNDNPVSATTIVQVSNDNDSSCRIKSFYASPSSVNSGERSTLYWETEGCTKADIDGASVSVNSGSLVTNNLYSNKTYTLNAENSQGIGVSSQTTVTVGNSNSNDCRITQFDASDTSISEGDYSRLTWDTEGCDRVKITDLGFVDLSGSDKVYPTSDKTYTITAYDEDGSMITDTVRIYVDSDDEDGSCKIDSFTSTDTYIDSGDRVTLRWRTTGCDDVSISHIGDVDDDGTEDVYPYSSTTYTLRARGNGDSDSDTIDITVGNGNGYYNGNVVTTVATSVSQSGAQLNGYLTGSNNGNASVYFEYGTSVNLGQRTSTKYTGSSYFNDYISGLSPKTIYYFRAVSTGSSNGTQYGSIEIFQTLGNQIIYYNNNTNTTTKTTKVIQGLTVIGTESPIVLQIENRYQTVGVGDTIDYTVFYKNISNMRLSNPMIQIYIPKGLTLLNASVGSYSEQDRIVSVPINDLYPDQEGVIYLQARVDSIDASLAQIVTTAVAAYTTPNGAQQNAMAYVFNNPRLNNINGLGAAAFGTGLFLGMNLVGWLLLITFILLLVLLVRSFYSKKETVVTTYHQ